MADAAVTPQDGPTRQDEGDVAPAPPASLEEALLRLQEAAQEIVLTRSAKGAERASGRFDKYLAYPDLLKAIRPELVKNRLVWQTFPTTLDGKPALRYRITFVGPPVESQEDVMLLAVAKDTAQAQGSGITYARRYSLLAVLDLAPEDDDGQAASTTRPEPVDPEKPVSDAWMAGLIEALGERSLSLEKVLERVGVKPGDVPTNDQGAQIKALLEEWDAKRKAAAEVAGAS